MYTQIFITSNNNNYSNKSEKKIQATFGKRNNVNFSSTSEIYNAVFENSFHPVYIGNSDGHILKFNEKFCKLFEYSEGEMAHVESFFLFDTKEEAYINFLKERNEKGIVKAVVTCIKRSGEKFPCRISSVVYKSDNKEERSMNTLVDISNNSQRWSLTQ